MPSEPSSIPLASTGFAASPAERFHDKPCAAHHPEERSHRPSTAPAAKRAMDSRSIHPPSQRSDNAGDTLRHRAKDRFQTESVPETSERTPVKRMAAGQAPRPANSYRRSRSDSA